VSRKKQQTETRYRIYISDGGTRFYLRDIVAHEKREHYFFDTDSRYAMWHRSFDTAMKYRERMVDAGYHPHIESF